LKFPINYLLKQGFVARSCCKDFVNPLPARLYPLGWQYNKIEQKFFAAHSRTFSNTFVEEYLLYPLK